MLCVCCCYVLLYKCLFLLVCVYVFVGMCCFVFRVLLNDVLKIVVIILTHMIDDCCLFMFHVEFRIDST